MTAPTKKRVNSRAKGKRGELQLAKALTELGHPATRGQQRKGGEDSPDVLCPSLSGWHLECKLTASCQMFSPAQLEAWMQQARNDAGGRAPLVVHRWNGARDWWVLVMPFAQPWYWQRLDLWVQAQAGLLQQWGAP